jgi:hypothetical protein
VHSMRFVAVLRAVDLDDQARCHAREVGNVRPNRYLPAKVRSVDWKTTQTAPETGFRVCSVCPEPTRGCAVKRLD